MDKKYLVEQLSVFSRKYGIPVDDELLGEIVNKCSFRVIPKGELLASMGDDTKTSGLVLSGVVRSYYIDSEGNDITRGFAPEGIMFMDEGFFGYTERICMWETLEETTVMLAETSIIKGMIRENNSFKDIWIRLLEHALRYKIYRENGFLVENATERYMHFKKMYPELSERASLKHIATSLGITPESLSRIRNAMKENS